MYVGIQLIAPDGFEALSKGTVYHFLSNHAGSGRAFLVEFKKIETLTKSGKRRTHFRALLNVLSRDRFEYGLTRKLVVPAPMQSKFPPWLARLEGSNLATVDSKRGKPKMTHASRVKHRATVIEPVLARLDDILSANDPDNEIARHARNSPKQQNENRFKLWVYTAACFGRDHWLLAPALANCGHYERQKKADAKKVGRHSLSGGAGHGYPATTIMIKRIEEGYDTYATLGRPLTRIYSIIMVKVFGCKVRYTKTMKGNKKALHYFHPKGESYPRFNQFRYYVHLKFGAEEVGKRKLGEVGYRNSKAVTTGKYSECGANLLEIVEADGFTAHAHPRGVVDPCTLPRLYVIRGRCGVSGKLAGIGFSFGSEKETAYRMMLFSMAVPKAYFCGLFGVPHDPEKWSNEGLPLFYVTDRGPGAIRPKLEELQQLIPLHELTESYSGQSKATIESSNPRETHLEGEPSFLQSQSNTIQLARTEILRLMKDNVYSNASRRITPEMEAAEVAHNPKAIWDFLEQRGRSNAYSIPIADAVRLLLTPIEVVIKEDGVELEFQRYDSPELRATGILKKVKAMGHTTVRAYVLDLCIRCIWVEVDGKIIEVAAKLPISDDEEQLFVSLLERKILASIRRRTASDSELSKFAADSDFILLNEELMGHMPDDGRRKKGRAPTRTEESRRESMELGQVTSRRKKIA